MIKYLGTWASINKKHAVNDLSPAATLAILIFATIMLFVYAIQEIDIANQDIQADIRAGTFQVGPYWQEKLR